MKRKQMLALVLVIVMMIGIIPGAEASPQEPDWYANHDPCIVCNSADCEWYETVLTCITYNNYYHDITGGYNCLCHDCGYRRWADFDRREPHKLVDDKSTVTVVGCWGKICNYCEFRCSHSKESWTDVPSENVVSNSYYEIEDGQNHYQVNVYDRYCKECYSYVYTTDFFGPLEPHNFTNGDTCICGYKKPVTGEEGQHVGVSAKIDTEYRQYNNATAHQKRDVYGYTCSICSETVIERYTEWIDENHKDSGEGWCLCCGGAVGAANDEAYPIITNLSVSPNAAGMSTPISVSGLVDGNGGTISRVRVSVFYNDALTSGKVYKDYEVNSAMFDLSTVGTIVPGATLAQDGTLLIPDTGSYSLAVFATNTNGKGQGDSPALCGFTVGSCTHPNYGYEPTGKGKTEKIDDEKHGYTFPAILTCTICGESWKGEHTVEGEHSMTIKTEHETLNSTFHLVKIICACSDGCGMKEVVKVTLADHTPDSEGKCTACEYIENAFDAWSHSTFDWNNPNNTGVKQLISTAVIDYTNYDNTLSVVMDSIVQAIVKYDDLFLGQINGRLTGDIEGSSEDFIGEYYTKQALADSIGSLYTPDPRYNNTLLTTLLSVFGVNGFKDLLIGEDELKALEGSLEEFIKWQKSYIFKLNIDDTKLAEEALKHLDDLLTQLKMTKNVSKLKGVFGKLGNAADVMECISALYVTYQISNADMNDNVQALKEYRAALIEGEMYYEDKNIEWDGNVSELIKTIDALIYDYEHLDVTASKYAAYFIAKESEKKGSAMVHPYLAAYNAVIGVSGSIMNMGGLSDDSEARQIAIHGELTITRLFSYMVKIEEKIHRNECITDKEMNRYEECLKLCYELRISEIDKLVVSGALSEKQKLEVLKFKEELQNGLEMINRKELGVVN